MTLHAADRRSLVDTVVEQLREQLAAGTWQVGMRIPTEHELAELLGVGRNTVREAVRCSRTPASWSPGRARAPM